MGRRVERRGGARRAPRRARRTALGRRPALLAVAGVAAVGLLGAAAATSQLGDDLRAADTAAVTDPGGGASSGAGDATGSTGGASSSPGPTEAVPAATTEAGALPVVPGVRFADRILTVPEMKRRFAKQGLVLTEGDPTRPTTFTIASLNVLGSSHTGRKGAAAGPARAARAGALVRARGIDVVGLQELQANQVGPFLSNAGMVAFPGSSRGALDGENSIAWDPDEWVLVEGRTHAIPYFGGQARNMPYVLLRNLATQRTAWFSNYHNPADVHGPAQGFRVAATAREAALVRELTADGTPMFTTGDMNERDSYACRFSAAGMHSADGARTVGGACRLPGDEWIDWIWGSEPVTFSDYGRDFSTRNGPRITDHPLVTATASIAPASEQCRSYDRHGTRYWFCPPAAG